MYNFNNIFNLLNSNKLKQKDLAVLLKTSDSVISEWKSGAKEPGVKAIAQISEYFNVTTDYLLGLADKPNLSESEKYVLSMFGKLDDSGKNNIIGRLELMTEQISESEN